MGCSANVLWKEQVEVEEKVKVKAKVKEEVKVDFFLYPGGVVRFQTLMGRCSNPVEG